MARYRVAVDVGGTFTDVFVLDEDTATERVAKVPSTPHDPMEAVMNGIAAADVDLRDTTLFSHGTTVATNALITRRFPPAAMVTTKGFRDVLEIRRGTKDDLWDSYNDVSPSYIRRRDRLEVAERVDYMGRVLEALDEDEARAVAAKLRRRGVQTVAVCFVNAYANPINEHRMREILEEELPDATISTSSQVLPEIFEYERFSTRVANAVLSPLVGGYVERLGERLREGGYTGDLLLLHSGGGVMTEALVQRYAVRLAASGIAAGAIAAANSPCCAAIATRSGSTWAARARTSRSSTTARCARRTSGQSSTATRSAFRALRSSRSAPVAARWRGLTRLAPCAMARSRRAPIRVLRATAAAVRSRRTRTPTSSSGASERNSSAAG
jgi:N-methylhydantoinase A/oxoprolinase/acetone carboxylase beta subunit